MEYRTERGLAKCGLACVLCSEAACPGCTQRDCEQADGCDVSICVCKKEIDGCYACDAFPCGKDMLQGVRNRAFNRYARRFGKQALLTRLRENHQNGIAYHRPDGLKGDYDTLDREEDILRLIRYGTHDPYARCPVLETERFRLRLVKMEDAPDLLACYSDPRAQALFNADCCTSGFCYHTLPEMEECVSFFVRAYAEGWFIRLAVVDKRTDRAVGTAEIFRAEGSLTGHDAWGVLRLDLAAPYETEDTIGALLDCAVDAFENLLDVDFIVTKAIPAAGARVAALQKAGFVPFAWPEPERDHYFSHLRQAP